LSECKKKTLEALQLFGLPPFPDYELVDSGNFRKLERFGPYFLQRPEPQAIWDAGMPSTEWERCSHAVFERKARQPEFGDDGNWAVRPGVREQWPIQYAYKGMHLHFRLGLTAFKHVGIFPEQAENWNFIYDHLLHAPITAPLVLNLFAYTGAASLAAKAAGADVIHVDAVRPVITWARQNMEASGLDGIRWVVEDALKFARKEAQRGRKYQAILLDPPAYGRGPEGEKWLLEKHLNELLGYCRQILDPENGLFLLNLYSLGFSPLIAQNLVRLHFPDAASPECGELFIPDRRGVKLPLGSFVRFVNQR
jgi:23S rRNA (cytosine1962-C5)-methyltransferase